MRGRRTLFLVLIAAALVGIAVLSAERLRQGGAASISRAAGPQSIDLDWRETYGPKGEQLAFRVKRFQVLEDGWRARLGVTNNTSNAYEVGDPEATLDRAFGLMLFSTGSRAELAQRNSSGTLPTIRPATRYEPRLPETLAPRSSWEGTISAPGALVASSWVRIVFGTLVAVGKTRDNAPEQIVWITDHAYRLRTE